MVHERLEVGMYAVAKAPLDGFEAQVSVADAQQFDSLFIWDHLQDFIASSVWDEAFSWAAAGSASPHEWFEYQTIFGYLAARFPRLRLGIGVTEPIRRHPIILAQAALTLAHLSQRAPILGIGSGERLGSEPYGLDFTSPVSRLEEALQIIRQSFDSCDPINFEGDHFQLRDAVIHLPAPAGRKPEIWIAAHGPRMLRLTGQYGDGWYPFLIPSPGDYASRLESLRAAACEADRDPDAITPALHALVVVAPTEAEALAMLDARPVRYFGLLLPNQVWEAFGLTHPFGKDFRGFLDILPEQYDRETVEAGMNAVPREMMQLTFWGTPDQVVARLRAFGEAGLRHVVPLVLSAAVSPEAAAYSMEAMAQIAHALKSGE